MKDEDVEGGQRDDRPQLRGHQRVEAVQHRRVPVLYFLLTR